MLKSGWKGAFGIDVAMDEKTSKMYLVEINARQPASTTYESQLQSWNMEHGTWNKKNVTTFHAHLASLLKLKYNKEELIKITDGAQIIYRVNNETVYNKKRLDDIVKKLQVTSYKLQVIRYNNTKPNSDLLRIQSKTGIMSGHNKFNRIGKIIKKILDIRY